MRILFSFLLILIINYCKAQQYYETFTPANGLVDARVNKIVQAADGRLFFLTRDGLSIYDGQRFINHTKLSGSTIGIVEDAIQLPDSSISLATFSGNWIKFKKNIYDPDSFIYKNIPEVSFIVPLPNKEHLVATNYGLFVYERHSQKPLIPERLTSSMQKLVPDNIAVSGNSIVFNYFPQATEKIFLADLTTGAIHDSLPVTPVITICNDASGIVYLCTKKGIQQLNRTKLQVKQLIIEQPWFHSLIPAGFECEKLFFDNQNNIWLINGGTGCCKIDPIQKTTTYFKPEDGLLPGIVSVFQDRENNYWFIAKGRGVQKLMQTNFETIKTIDGSSLNITYTLQNAPDKSLYIFTNNEPFLLSKKKLTGFNNLKKPFSPTHFVWQNDFWEITKAGVFINNKKDTLTVPIDNTIKTATQFSSFYTAYDMDQNLMLAGNHFILLKNKKESCGVSLPYFADNIVQDENKNYWAFCRSNDVVKYKEQNGSLVKLGNYVHSGLEARYALHWQRDTFLIGTRYNGLLIIKANEKSLKIIGQLTRKNGLSNDFIETLLKIDDHRIAAGTAAGLDIINISDFDTTIENLSARINHFEPIIQLAKDDNGIIYARSENYQLFKYDPFFKGSSSYIPEAWLSSVTVNGNKTPITENKFSYRENNFTFSVSSPSFTDNRSVLFEFYLQNEKTEWRQNGNKADFQINNLAPGIYTLSITIKYPGSIYPNKKIEYQFIIRPPLWKTWWFIAGSCLLLLFGIYLIIRSYYKRQLEKQKVSMEKELAVEQERTRMARELHDGLGSMLSGIKHSFTALQKDIDLDTEQEIKFHQNIGKLNESIKELRNISHSIYSDSLLKYGLDILLAEYCKNLSQNTNIKINFASLNMDGVLLTEEQSFHIYRIVQELLQNVMNHSEATEALVQLSFNNKQLYIAVEDNGKGFNLDAVRKAPGIGLKNLESRVKILKGKLDYRTAPDQGTSVLIEMPVVQGN